MPASDIVGVQPVTISNPIEDTPEGMACMDRIRAASDRERVEFAAEHGDAALAARDWAEQQVEREIFFGTGA